MVNLTRRSIIAGLSVAPVAAPSIIRAQTSSAPIRVGFLSDVAGPYHAIGGPGNKVAAEMAVADFGGAVLGRPLEIIQADNFNKPDVASSLAREWIADNKVTALADGSASSAALAIQDVARRNKTIYLITGPSANDLIGKQCSPYGFQFAGSSYSQTKGSTVNLTKQGKDTWFIVVVDYASGYTMEESISTFVKEAGGKVVGSVRTPFGTTDYSSYILKAKASGAKAIALTLAGGDLQNFVKQAHEFGILEGGQTISTPILTDPDVYAVGQEMCQGLIITAHFYWTANDQTAAFGQRFISKVGTPPTVQNAAAYISVNHWLKAVKAASTVGGDEVAAKMRELPVNDFNNKDVRIYDNGCVAYPMHTLEVKKVSESKNKFDVFKSLSVLPADQANPPPALYGCSLVRI